MNIKVLVDDNNVTIAGHPQEYLPGYDLTRTLNGYGMTTETTMGEDLDGSVRRSVPRLLTIAAARAGHQAADGGGYCRRRGQSAGPRSAQGRRGHQVPGEAAAATRRPIALLKAAMPDKSPLTFKGSSGVGKNRDDFGKIINGILDGMTPEQRVASVRVFDNDLEGSCGLHHIRKQHPEVFVRGGIMERGNFSAAAGFGSRRRQAGHLCDVQRVP